MFFSNYIFLIFSEAISSSKLRSSLKYANITPAFTKCCRSFKENYRPVSILPIISKIFEKLMSKPLSTFFQSFFQFFSFWKGFSTQHCLLLDKWNKVVGNYQAFGTIVTDLPKAFDYLNHDLLIVKVYSHSLPLS